ncbi:MAG: hypothetical protein LN417_02845, partial [Candidatus Thermoplasmatota archaeon]|nr:hypothetical protein [Candidatus Thermoplasmatota archaeon]
LDGRGHPHIAYREYVNGDLKYAKWTGSAWSIETVDTIGHISWFISIAVDSDDNPHMSYYVLSPDWDLKYAKWTGSAWSIETVDSIGYVGWDSSIALDANDNPHISYFDYTNHDLKYSKWTGSTWSIETVDSAGDVGRCTSIALDSNGNPHISYQDYAPNIDLKYARWDGSTWSIETVDSTGNVGFYPSIALDNGDSPHISYFFHSLDDLKYATKADLQPPSRSVTLDIDPDTLNLKSKGRWITAYLSAENASVYDINISSILLQDTLPPERWDYQDDILMLKFNRQDLIAILEVGESVEIKIGGKWEDGSDFEAFDHIRVINPGKK